MPPAPSVHRAAFTVNMPVARRIATPARTGLRTCRGNRRDPGGNLRPRRWQQIPHVRTDVHYRLELGFLDAINGSKQQVTLPEGAALDITIPPAPAPDKPCGCAARGCLGLTVVLLAMC